MDNNVSVSYCTLATWALWITGAIVFLLIAFGPLPQRNIGFGFMTYATGCVLYQRKYARASRRQVDQAYELGRLSVEAARIRPIR